MKRRLQAAHAILGELRYWLPRLRRLTNAAPSRREARRQTVRWLTWFLGCRLGIAPRRPFVMRGAYGELTVRDHSEMLVILEVLIDEAYAHPDLPAAVDRVLDIGANIGAAALWFRHRYPRAQIVAVEADPRTAAVARANLANEVGVEVLNAAVSDHGGEATLWVAAESWASSTAITSGTPLRVPAVTLDGLLEGAGPRVLLKLDAEGAEHAALRACGRLDQVAFVTGEYHPVAGESYASLVARLDGFTVEPAAAQRRCTFTARRS